jgi:hypothetical protein
LGSVTNNHLVLLLLAATVFMASGLAVLDYRSSSSKGWSRLRGIAYVLLGLVLGAFAPLLSGRFGGLESGTSGASPGAVAGSTLFAAAEVFTGVLLFSASRRGSLAKPPLFAVAAGLFLVALMAFS